MKFSVIHPTARLTADFELPWWLAADSVFHGCNWPQDVEYILVVHHSRRDELDWQAQYRFGRVVLVTNYGRDCLVDQCNAGQIAATGEIICWNQDDMRYPEHWDTEVLKLIPDTSKAVCIQALTDGTRRDLLTLPAIATRVLFDRIGLLSPEYDGMFSDDEWSFKARTLGMVIPSTLYFQHLHPLHVRRAQGTAMDSVHAMENREEAYKIGREVLERRRALGFPRVPFPGESVAPAGGVASEYPLLALCVPGYDFTFPWLQHFFALGTRLRDEGYLVKRYFGYSSNVYNARMNIATEVIEAARTSGDTPKYVLWLDSDNVLLDWQLSGLLHYLDNHSDVDAIVGWCWIRKGDEWLTSAGDFWKEDGVHLEHWNVATLLAGNTPTERAVPKRIESTGFPCVLMRYSAFERLGPGAFRPLTKADLPAYFDGQMPAQEVTEHWFCGEDTSWCLAAKKAGLKLVVDPCCKVGHLKEQLLEPDFKVAGVNGQMLEAPPLEYTRTIVRCEYGERVTEQVPA